MKRIVYPYLLTLAMMMAAAGDDKKMFGSRNRNVPSYPTRRDLPRWDVNGHVIFAKDARRPKNMRRNAGYGLREQ